MIQIRYASLATIAVTNCDCYFVLSVFRQHKPQICVSFQLQITTKKCLFVSSKVTNVVVVVVAVCQNNTHTRIVVVVVNLCYSWLACNFEHIRVSFPRNARRQNAAFAATRPSIAACVSRNWSLKKEASLFISSHAIAAEVFVFKLPKCVYFATLVLHQIATRASKAVASNCWTHKYKYKHTHNIHSDTQDSQNNVVGWCKSHKPQTKA